MSNLSGKIDWISFTFKSQDEFCSDEYAKFCKVFPEFQDLQEKGIEVVCRHRGDRFYDHVVTFNDYFRIAYRVKSLGGVQSSRNLGVNVQIPSHGLEYVFNLFGLQVNQVQEFFQLLYVRNCSISRLDIAYDDFNKTFKPYDWEIFRVQDRLVTNYKSFKYISSGRRCKDTFYIGNRSSGKVCRIYDKAGESNGTIDAIRYEFEYHGKFCEDFAYHIREYGTVPAFDNVFSCWVSKVLPEGFEKKNRSEAKPDSVYEKFIADAKLSFSEQLTISKFTDHEQTLKKSAKWIVTQVFPTIKTFINVFGWAKFRALYEASNCHSLDSLFRSDYAVAPDRYDTYVSDLIYKKQIDISA